MSRRLSVISGHVLAAAPSVALHATSVSKQSDSGKAGEKATQKLVGGEFHKSFPTREDLGVRIVDVYVPETKTAHESKVGPVSKSSHVEKQVEKDKILISRGFTVVWHFWLNAAGKGGPSGPLKSLLSESGIKFVEHPYTALDYLQKAAGPLKAKAAGDALDYPQKAAGALRAKAAGDALDYLQKAAGLLKAKAAGDVLKTLQSAAAGAAAASLVYDALSALVGHEISKEESIGKALGSVLGAAVRQFVGGPMFPIVFGATLAGGMVGLMVGLVNQAAHEASRAWEMLYKARAEIAQFKAMMDAHFNNLSADIQSAEERLSLLEQLLKGMQERKATTEKLQLLAEMAILRAAVESLAEQLVECGATADRLAAENLQEKKKREREAEEAAERASNSRSNESACEAVAISSVASMGAFGLLGAVLCPPLLFGMAASAASGIGSAMAGDEYSSAARAHSLRCSEARAAADKAGQNAREAQALKERTAASLRSCEELRKACDRFESNL